jgi:hypothetical protein
MCGWCIAAHWGEQARTPLKSGTRDRAVTADTGYASRRNRSPERMLARLEVLHFVNCLKGRVRQ